MSDLHLTITAAAGREYVAFVRSHLLKAHQVLRPPLRELSIAFVGDARMGQLHDRFMGIPTPTDVLTFPLDENSRRQVVAGEVIVCVPQAKRQAKLRSIPVRRELLLYALHGMLHLCAFDDRTRAGYEKMHAKEDEVLSRIGIAPTFAPSSTRKSPSPRRRTPARGAR